MTTNPSEAIPVARFFIDHGTIHDRVTGKHVVTDGTPPFEDSLEQVCALLNSLATPPAPIPVAREAVAWKPGNEIPPVAKRSEREYIVAVKRASSGKVYSFACSYLNALPLNCDDCPKDSEVIPCKECTDDGCPFTGWFYLTGEDGESGSYQTLSLMPGDELMAWREVPQWDTTPPAPDRAAVVEECAKVADHYSFITTTTTTAQMDNHAKERARIIAKAIRALAPKTGGGE